MARVTGAQLRAWRQRAGWDVPETARQLRRAAGDDHLPDHDTLVRAIRRRERDNSSVTERYILLYARALDITPGQLCANPPPAEQSVHAGTNAGALAYSPASDGPGPSAVTMTDVGVIRGMLDALTASDRQFGGRHSRQYATAYVSEFVRPRLNAHGKEQVLRSFFAVAVEFTLRVASMNLDAGHTLASRQLLGIASSIAHQTDDLSLEAWVLARYGEQEIHGAMLARRRGDVKTVRDHIERAVAYTGGAEILAASAPPAARAFIFAKRALALSMTGERAITQRALGEVWRSYDNLGKSEEPAWMRVYEWGHLRHEEGRCYYNLGMGREASQAAADSMSARTDLRPHAFSLGVHAIGYAQAGEIEAACSIAHDLVDLAVQLSSDRVAVRVAEVLEALRPYRPAAAVAELQEAAGPVLRGLCTS